ncbi:hypothetical protein [Candidatus Cyanaurora vandensis]|uniref:hypothetical protein n=1 Tax=Candidatus Cyanaurora vandensis TaxID=2714958 RepID=UPI002579D878|nr:hypothetical protein [Candidatus Cyanaurora vandensis]
MIDEWLVSLVVPGTTPGLEPVYTIGVGAATPLTAGIILQANYVLSTRAGMIQIIERDNGQVVRVNRIGPNTRVYLEGPASKIPSQVMTVAGEQQVPSINKQGELLSLQQGSVADGTHRPNCYQMQAQIVYSYQLAGAEPIQYEVCALNGPCSVYTYDNAGVRVPLSELPMGFKQTIPFTLGTPIPPATSMGAADFVTFGALLNPVTWTLN